jgi:hypothetical protein
MPLLLMEQAYFWVLQLGIKSMARAFFRPRRLLQLGFLHQKLGLVVLWSNLFTVTPQGVFPSLFFFWQSLQVISVSF